MSKALSLSRVSKDSEVNIRDFMQQKLQEAESKMVNILKAFHSDVEIHLDNFAKTITASEISQSNNVLIDENSLWSDEVGNILDSHLEHNGEDEDFDQQSENDDDLSDISSVENGGV